MSARASGKLARAPPLLTRSLTGLLPVVARHQVAHRDRLLALELSDLLEAAVSRGTLSTYRCGFASLVDFCNTRKLSALPVDAITLAAWMLHKCKSVKVKSVVKYLCGIRFAHIMEGLEWRLSDNPLIQTTISSLMKRYPSSRALQKVPLSL